MKLQPASLVPFQMSVTANGHAVRALLTDDLTMPLVTEEIKSAKGEKKSLSEVIAEIGQIRETGIAWDQNEHTDGISVVGCAFRAPSGLIYAISITAGSSTLAITVMLPPHISQLSIGNSRDSILNSRDSILDYRIPGTAYLTIGLLNSRDSILDYRSP